MARIVAGAAVPRGPQLYNPPEQWPAFGERDKTNPWLFDVDGSPITYEQLLGEADDSVRGRLDPELWQSQYASVVRARQTVRSAFDAADPDVVVVMGDDERELYLDDETRPKLAVYRGRDWEWRGQTYDVAVGLTDHVIRCLRASGREVELVESLPPGMPMQHSFGNIYADLLLKPLPIVPVMVNIHYAVNQTTPIESYRIGQTIRAAIESWDGPERVGVAGNGGLSAGVLREALDRDLLAALQDRDTEALAEIPYKWIQGPSGEIYNWIGAAGALEGLTMRVIDYIPAYRSAAGTGCGMAFAIWE
jgi:3-O-methylgallate 3,4-dioxygenase